MKTFEIIKSLFEESKNQTIDLIKRRYKGCLTRDESLIKKKIEDKGYAIIPDFLDKESCEELQLIIDQIIATNDKIWVDEIESDHRVFFLDLFSEKTQDFFNNDFILKILCNYERSSKYQGFTLANKLVFKNENMGSGGGWHRDFVKRKQTKAILYLNDVNDRIGPFQFLEGSHKYKNIIKMQKEFDFSYNQSRFSNHEIDNLNNKYPSLLTSVEGKQGTLLLVDTRGIHRGKPIEEGVRYALTNYYWFNAPIPKHIKKLNPFNWLNDA